MDLPSSVILSNLIELPKKKTKKSFLKASKSFYFYSFHLLFSFFVVGWVAVLIVAGLWPSFFVLLSFYLLEIPIKFILSVIFLKGSKAHLFIIISMTHLNFHCLFTSFALKSNGFIRSIVWVRGHRRGNHCFFFFVLLFLHTQCFPIKRPGCELAYANMSIS